MSDILNPQRVAAVIGDCLYAEAEYTDQTDMVKAEGIIHTYGFHPQRLESHRDEIYEMLAELPDQFWHSRGGGWSFLQACEDRHGELWTGVHWTMEQLICMGIGLGLAQWLGPRKLWAAHPGGMPYLEFIDGAERGSS